MIKPLAAFGLAGVVAGPIAVGLLHVMPPTDRINPVRRTISEYALHETAWLFNTGVLALAAGSLAVLIALARAGVTRLNSLGGLGLLLWCVGLAAVVYFPKHNWALGPSGHGTIHRAASLVAFVGLPVGALVIAWAWRRAGDWRGRAFATAGFAVLALLFFGIIVGAFALQPFTGVKWWQAIPLGAVERGLAIAEICVMLTLGWWALTGRRSPAGAGGMDAGAGAGGSGSSGRSVAGAGGMDAGTGAGGTGSSGRSVAGAGGIDAKAAQEKHPDDREEDPQHDLAPL